MINTILRIFGPKQIRDTSAIVDGIDQHWRETDNFLLSFNRYLFEIDQKYNLRLPSELTLKLIVHLVTEMSLAGLTKANILKLVSEFIYYYIFGGEKPNEIRHSNEYIHIHLHDKMLPFIIQKTPIIL